MKADKNEEKTMTISDFNSLLSAIAQLVTAYAAYVAAICHRH